MKKKLRKIKHFYAFLILLISLLFVWYNYKTAPSYKVLNVKHANYICVDINNNSLCDNDEWIKLYGISAFPEKFGKQTKFLFDKYMIKEENSVVLGVMSKDYAEKELLNKDVKVVILDTKTSEKYKIAKVYLNSEDFSLNLLKNGWATAFTDDYKIYENHSAIKKNISFSKKFNYQLKNLKNGKIHTLDCEYGRKSSHYEIGIFDDEIYKKDYCGVCHGGKNKSHSHKKREKAHDTSFENGNLKVYFLDFTNQLKPDNTCSKQACKTLLNAINSAKTSIDFAIYGLGDEPKILNALKNASARGVKIRYVIDETAAHSNIYSKTNELKATLKNFKTDYIDGESKKFNDYIMHNKFFIFDDSSVWLGTANVSETDLAGYSANNVIFANSKELAKIFKNEFEKMYNGQFHTKKTSDGIKTVLVGQTSFKIAFSPQDKIVTSTIIPLINSAKKSIYIETFIFTHKALANAVTEAQKRGVDVKIIVDATTAGSPYSMVKTMRANGVKIKTENFAGKMHMKTIIIDDSYFITGSMNLTKSGESYNDENVLVINDNGLNSKAKEFFNYLWGRIPEKYLTKNPPAESWASYGSCYDGIDNDYDGKIDSADEGCVKDKKKIQRLTKSKL